MLLRGTLWCCVLCIIEPSSWQKSNRCPFESEVPVAYRFIKSAVILIFTNPRHGHQCHISVNVQIKCRVPGGSFTDHQLKIQDVQNPALTMCPCKVHPPHAHTGYTMVGTEATAFLSLSLSLPLQDQTAAKHFRLRRCT